MQNLLQNFPLAINVRVCVRIKFWQNAHVRAMCVRPKIKCANVRACEAKNRRNSQIAKMYFFSFSGKEVLFVTSRFDMFSKKLLWLFPLVLNHQTSL